MGGFLGLEELLGRLIARLRHRPAATPVEAGDGFDSYEERLLREAGDVDAVSSATLKRFRHASLKELQGQVPHSKIGNAAT